MSSFDESAVRRGQPDNAGKFRAKENTAPPGGLEAQPRRNPRQVGIGGEFAVEAAFVEDRHWNGFAMPYFDRESVDKIAAWCEQERNEYGDDASSLLEWDGDELYEVRRYDDPEVEAEHGERSKISTITLADGSVVYGVGAGSWVWNEEDETDDLDDALHEARIGRSQAAKDVELFAALNLRQAAHDAGAASVRVTRARDQGGAERVHSVTYVYADGRELAAPETNTASYLLQNLGARADRHLGEDMWEFDARATGSSEADFTAAVERLDEAELDEQRAAVNVIRHILPEGAGIELERRPDGKLDLTEASRSSLYDILGTTEDRNSVAALALYLTGRHAMEAGAAHNPVTGRWTLNA